MNPEVPDARLKELILWVLRRRKHYRVRGNSMLPIFEPGDMVLADPHAYHDQNPKTGEIVVAWHPLWPELKVIKRVCFVRADGSVDLTGDNPAESTDFDSIAPDNILGRVTSKFP